MKSVCEYTGEQPLKLYLVFLDDLVSSELHDDCLGEDGASTLSPRMQPTGSLQVLWSSNNARRLLLLRALHGAQEAADSEESPTDLNCLNMCNLVKVRRCRGL